MIDKSACTSCHSSGVKIWRRHKAKRFCQNCYFKYFKKDNCSSCGKLSRIPTFVMNPVCLNCDRAVPCIRCGKEDYDIGKITEYGPACKSCSFYFKEPEQCQICGKNSRRLSTYSHLDHDLKVCLKCSREKNGTCKACHRYRLLYPNDIGEPLCKKCLLIGEKVCEKCGNMMPAGYGKSCADCYWSELLEKRLEMGMATLTHSTMKERFRDFGYWLYEKNGSNKSAIKINKLLPFFQAIDEKWEDVPEFKELVDNFGANRMRHFRLPMKWFEHKLGMEIDDGYKLEVTEITRIEKYLVSINESNPMKEAYINYQNFLLTKFKNKNIGIRSARLSLGAVTSLILSVNNYNEFNQEFLDKHMVTKPGQKANLTGFINYLNELKNKKYVLRVDGNKARKYRKRILGNKLTELLRGPVTDSQTRKWLLYGLQYFHNLPMRIAGTALKNGVINQDDEGYVLTWKGKNYFIPSMSGATFELS